MRDGAIATTYPTDYRDPKVPRFDLGRETVLASTEGFVTFPRFTKLPQHWQLDDGSRRLETGSQSMALKLRSPKQEGLPSK